MRHRVAPAAHRRRSVHARRLLVRLLTSPIRQLHNRLTTTAGRPFEREALLRAIQGLQAFGRVGESDAPVWFTRLPGCSRVSNDDPEPVIVARTLYNDGSTGNERSDAVAYGVFHER